MCLARGNRTRWWPIVVLVSLAGSVALADTLDDVRARGRLVWGADAEGGGPYVYSDPDRPERLVGFEVELAERLARALGVAAEFRQCQWDSLPDLLATSQIDLILNGYELTAARTARMGHTHPYYVYELALLARRDDNSLADWNDLARPVGGRRRRVGLLGTSAARSEVERRFGEAVEIALYDGNTDAMRDVETGQLDATVVDLPVAVFYRERFAGLKQVGQPTGRGYYVVYLRQGDNRLRQAIDEALVRLAESGELQAVYAQYGLWNAAQEELLALAGQSDAELGVKAQHSGGWQVIASRGPILVASAGMTALLACASMPLAIAVGLAVALVRLYGPAPLRWLALAYVELVRGTPLLLQLYFVFFVLPEIGIGLSPLYAAIGGLAINYSAYEAEIYRAGLQAIPRGQMEAALALGMSPGLALRRIVVPQAVRLVIPPVTNDFIALFKDTSVCSVITVVELTKQYSIQRNDTGATLELAALTALLYLAMSLPLSRLATWLERRRGPAARAAAA